MKYEVVTITNNISKYPQYKDDTEKRPLLVKLVEDEVEKFVIDENGETYFSADFFREVYVGKFETL
jgi:hypothetical protein